MDVFLITRLEDVTIFRIRILLRRGGVLSVMWSRVKSEVGVQVSQAEWLCMTGSPK